MNALSDHADQRRIFVYEFITGGGTYAATSWGMPSGSMLAEGLAMIRAISADFAQLAQWQVVTIRDTRIPNFASPAPLVFDVGSDDDERRIFQHLAQSCDATLIIAPEIDNCLLNRVQQAENLGARLISPDSDFVSVASDKLRTAQALRAAGVPTPATYRLTELQRLPDGFLWPAVVKPVRGAGSVDIQCARDRQQLVESTQLSESHCAQSYHPGRPASVAFLCGRSGNQPLQPCWQRIDRQRDFAYLGGELITNPDVARRVIDLGRLALESLPPTIGYVGIDVLVGDSTDQDMVIEINPRLTTSYVGLRAASRVNLAQGMLMVARGQPFELSFDTVALEFDAAGHITATRQLGD